MMGGLMGEVRKKTSDGDSCWSGVLVEQKLEIQGGRNFFAGSSAYRWSVERRGSAEKCQLLWGRHTQRSSDGAPKTLPKSLGRRGLGCRTDEHRRKVVLSKVATQVSRKSESQHDTGGAVGDLVGGYSGSGRREAGALRVRPTEGALARGRHLEASLIHL